MCPVYCRKCCHDFHAVIISQTLDSVSIHAFELGLPEHAGDSGVQLSVGAEMEAYGDQAAAASHQFCCKSGAEPSM